MFHTLCRGFERIDEKDKRRQIWQPCRALVLLWKSFAVASGDASLALVDLTHLTHFFSPILSSFKVQKCHDKKNNNNLNWLHLWTDQAWDLNFCITNCSSWEGGLFSIGAPVAAPPRSQTMNRWHYQMSHNNVRSIHVLNNDISGNSPGNSCIIHHLLCIKTKLYSFKIHSVIYD